MTSPTDNTGYPKLASTLYQAFVEFPASAVTIARQQDIDYSAMHNTTTTTAATTNGHTEAEGESDYKIDPALALLCQESESVSARLARQPDLAPGNVWKELFSRSERSLRSKRDIRDIGKGYLSEDELEQTRKCGTWGPKEPSDLFLRVRHLIPPIFS